MYLCFYYYMGLSKEYKNSVVSWWVCQLKKLNLSDKSIGFFMRSIHVNLPLYCIIIMVYCSKTANVCLLVFLICISISFLAFDGCVLSKIEHKLDGLDVTLVDPLLEMLDFETTNENRMNISIIIAIFYLAFAFSVYFIRFVLVPFSIEIENPLVM